MVKIKTYSASDYAALITGNLAFYYGYEQTVPEDADLERDEYEWAFVVKQDNQEVFRMAPSQFKEYMDKYDFENLDSFNCKQVLLAGIGIFLHDKTIGDKHE